jgi:hypothetical protein
MLIAVQRVARNFFKPGRADSRATTFRRPGFLILRLYPDRLHCVELQ